MMSTIQILSILLPGVISVTSGLKLSEALPIPWLDFKNCKVDDPYFHQSNSTPTTLCDPDAVLPSDHRMITNELLTMCREDSIDDTAFVLYVVQSIVPDGNRYGKEKKNFSSLDSLMDQAVNSFNLTKEYSSVFLLVTKDPFQVGVWHSDSLVYTFIQSDIDDIKGNITRHFLTNHHLPSAVNKLIAFFCEKVRAPRYHPSKWDALTFLWMILVIALGAAVTSTVVHLIVVRYKATHGDGALRYRRGRPNLGPLSMEIDDFGSTPFEPSGNLLLSTSDVTALGPQHSSTANLINPNTSLDEITRF